MITEAKNAVLPARRGETEKTMKTVKNANAILDAIVELMIDLNLEENDYDTYIKIHVDDSGNADVYRWSEYAYGKEDNGTTLLTISSSFGSEGIAATIEDYAYFIGKDEEKLIEEVEEHLREDEDEEDIDYDYEVDFYDVADYVEDFYAKELYEGKRKWMTENFYREFEKQALLALNKYMEDTNDDED